MVEEVDTYIEEDSLLRLVLYSTQGIVPILGSLLPPHEPQLDRGTVVPGLAEFPV